MHGSTLIIAAALFVVSARSEAAIYTDEAAFQAEIGEAKLVGSPLYSAIYTDAYGNFSVPATVSGVSFPAAVEGAVSGQFGCFGNYNPCRGAFRETISLPYQITAISGQLSYYDQGIGGNGVNTFDLPPSVFFVPHPDPLSSSSSPYSYSGFFAKTFAPTDTLILTWAPGLSSYDATAMFMLSSASVVVATSEPATLVLLLVPILGIIIQKRGRQAGT